MDEWELKTRSPAYAEVTAIFAEREAAASEAAARTNVDNRDRLIQLATAAYGSRWQTEAAGALGVSDRSVRAWLSGKTPVAEGVVKDLRGVVTERISLLRTALDETAIEPVTSVLPILLGDPGGSGAYRTSILTISDIRVGEGEASDGDLVRASLELRNPETDVAVELLFEESLADGIFSTLNSHFRTWRHHEWVELLGSDLAADVVFEAAKGLVRIMRPDLFGTGDDEGLRQVLAEHGYTVVGRDKDAHFHWRVVREETGEGDWHPSLRAAVRELLE